MATKTAEEQPADHVNQSDEVRITPSQQYPSVIISDNHLEAGAIQGANIVNSTLNDTVIKISVNDRLNTYIIELRKRAAEQKRQGNLIKAILIGFGIIISGILSAILYFVLKIWRWYTSSVLLVKLAVPLALLLVTATLIVTAMNFTATTSTPPYFEFTG